MGLMFLKRGVFLQFLILPFAYEAIKDPWEGAHPQVLFHVMLRLCGFLTMGKLKQPQVSRRRRSQLGFCKLSEFALLELVTNVCQRFVRSQDVTEVMNFGDHRLQVMKEDGQDHHQFGCHAWK